MHNYTFITLCKHVCALSLQALCPPKRSAKAKGSDEEDSDVDEDEFDRAQGECGAARGCSVVACLC